jgi:hypothetical protein
MPPRVWKYQKGKIMHNDVYKKSQRKKVVKKINKTIYDQRAHTPAALKAASKRDSLTGK